MCPLVAAVAIPVAEDPWQARDAICASLDLDLQVPPARAAELRPVAARLQTDWARKQLTHLSAAA